MFAAIAQATASFPKAAMFALYDKGYRSLFEQLVACIISIRTRDETSLPLAEKLLTKARTPKEMLAFSFEKLADLLHGATFPGQKAKAILALAQTAADRGGKVPQQETELLNISGLGPKCVHLALGIACGTPAISVDVHVHRVVNRWGLVRTKTPEATMKKLETIIPQDDRIDVNRLLMPFGKNICVAIKPFCSECPVYAWCQRIGVESHR